MIIANKKWKGLNNFFLPLPSWNRLMLFWENIDWSRCEMAVSAANPSAILFISLYFLNIIAQTMFSFFRPLSQNFNNC